MRWDPDDYTVYDEWKEEEEMAMERLLDEEQDYYDKMAGILSSGTRDDVRNAIRQADGEGRGPYDIQDAMLGAEYPIDAGGFSGTKEQYLMVLEEMRLYGDETGDENWTAAAGFIESDLAEQGWTGFGGRNEPASIRGTIGGVGEAWKKVAKGIGTTVGSIAGAAISSMEAPRTGDIAVAAYDYTNENGKRVHVRAHKRKRS